jgi:uncharacterized Fe-S center protein
MKRVAQEQTVSGVSRREFLRFASAGVVAGAAASLAGAPLAGAAETGGDAMEKNHAQETPDTPPKVYFYKDITAANLVALYKALNTPVSGKVGLKMHMGDPGNVNYLRPELARDLCRELNATLVECNVFYTSPRQTTEGNLQSAREHGFTFAPIDIMDAEGEIRLPIHGGKRLREALFGSHVLHYDWLVSLAHFKGHVLAGYGGAFKNLAIGCASVAGKAAIHMDSPTAAQWSSHGEPYFEKLIEYNKALMDVMGKNMLYINVLNNLSVRCDCDPTAPPPVMPDIGMVASLDPVAVDRASLDLVYARPEAERRALTEVIEKQGGAYQVVYAEKMGLGSQRYELVTLG